MRLPSGPGLAELGFAPDLLERLRSVVGGDGRGPQLLLSGPHGAGKLALADAIAQARGERLLIVDARGWATAGEVQATMRRAGLAAGLAGALVFLHGVEALARRDPPSTRALMEALAAEHAQFVVASVAPLATFSGAVLRALRVEIGFPPAAARAAAWRRALTARGLVASPQAIEQVAGRFVLGAAQIEQAAHEEAVDAGAARPGGLSGADLAAAARAQCGAQLGSLTQRITPMATLGSLVLPTELHAQLREICARVGHARDGAPRLGRGQRASRGVVGVTALFAGPSGTGKTLAAEAIAHELGFDLYRIDLAADRQQVHRRNREEPRPRLRAPPSTPTPCCSSTRPMRCSASAPK